MTRVIINLVLWLVLFVAGLFLIGTLGFGTAMVYVSLLALSWFCMRSDPRSGGSR